MDLRWLAAVAALAVAGCTGPVPPVPAASDEETAIDESVLEWTPEGLMAAALGLPPPEPRDTSAEDVFRQAAPWALEPPQPKPMAVTSFAVLKATVQASTQETSVRMISQSRSANVTGPVHAFDGTVEWTDVTGSEWRACAVRDGQPIPEAPCAVGPSPLRLAWTAAPEDSLPAGRYGIRVVPAGALADAIQLDARLAVHWTTMG